MNDYVVCNKCGWVHFPITEDKAREDAKSFKAYFDQLADDKKQTYYGRLEYDINREVEQQKKCFRCGNSHEDFHEATELDSVPMGATIQGIIKAE